MAYVCGLGFYEMYFNGERVGEQVLAPAVTNYDRRSLKNCCIIMMTNLRNVYFIMCLM